MKLHEVIDAIQKPYFYLDEKDSSMETILENLNKGILYIVGR